MEVIKYKAIKKSEKTTELVKAQQTRYNVRWEKLDCMERVVKILRDVFQADINAEEHAYMLALTSNFRLIGVFELSIGSSDRTPMPVREMFARALALDAEQIILAHNHPNGEVEPSEEDISVAKQIVKLGRFLGCPLVDSIVIGAYDDSTGAYSIRGHHPELWKKGEKKNDS